MRRRRIVLTGAGLLAVAGLCSGPSGAPLEPDEPMYSAVFAVMPGTGMGAGFLVDSAGLILTDDRVTRDATDLSVLVAAGTRVPAQVLSSDHKEFAILRVHPDAVAGLAVPAWLEASADPALVTGHPVVAAYRTLDGGRVRAPGTITALDARTIRSDTAVDPLPTAAMQRAELPLADVAQLYHGALDPIASGGPLFDEQGRVVAVNLFGLAGRSGPAMSRRIHLAQPLLDQARLALSRTGPPPFERLPTVSRTRIPQESLAALTPKDRALQNYEINSKDYQATFYTPQLLHALAARTSKSAVQTIDDVQADAARRHLTTLSTLGASDAVVLVEGEKRWFGFSWLPSPGTFQELELLRDGAELRPLFKSRRCIDIQIEEGKPERSCTGIYLYSPDAFRGEGRYEVRLFGVDGPDQPQMAEVKSKLVERILGDLRPWFEERKRQDAPSKP